jgi:hypothetical protein
MDRLNTGELAQINNAEHLLVRTSKRTKKLEKRGKSFQYLKYLKLTVVNLENQDVCLPPGIPQTKMAAGKK